MNKDCFKHLAGREEKTLPRLKHPRIGRDKAARPFTLTIHDLSDRSAFPKIHQWRTDPLMFSIHTRIDIRPADTFRLNGVTYKVKSCEEFRIDRQVRVDRKLGEDVRYFEVKMMVWGRRKG